MNHATRSYARNIFPFLRSEKNDKTLTKMLEKLPAYMDEIENVINRLPENGSHSRDVVFNFGNGRTITVTSNADRALGETKKLHQEMEIDFKGAKTVTERTAFKIVNNEFHFEKTVTQEKGELEKPKPVTQIPREPITKETKEIATKLLESTLTFEEKRAYVLALAAEPGAVSDKLHNAPTQKTSVQKKATELLSRQDFSNESLVGLIDAVDRSPIGETPSNYMQTKMQNMKVVTNFLPDNASLNTVVKETEQNQNLSSNPTTKETPKPEATKPQSQPSQQMEGPMM